MNRANAAQVTASWIQFDREVALREDRGRRAPNVPEHRLQAVTGQSLTSLG